MSVYAFIFARGNSKGLPGKNIRMLGGHPLIAHSIRVAQQVAGIDRIFVSTDSDEIAVIAETYGVTVIRRPDELATDTAPEWLAWRHAISYLHAQGHKFDVFVSLPATSPLRSVEDVEQCLACIDRHTDVVVTVTPASRSPFFNMVVRDSDGVSQLVCSGSSAHRRQDAPAVYDMTTVAYVATPTFILTNERIFSGRVRSVIVPRHRAVDIDDIYDFKMAEMLLADKENNYVGR
ncbi:N-acylneuraminate cytidylyltransferase [Pseudomonas cedrina]|uniref:Acylneuraminate cytidylyltransferase n=2 Tax=Pseudomonas cedrina TaxID=651740 RepID=A0A1V2KI08_PSECE|nr:acylneuraminate cytidylyltransferase family protein [Pseudomonas cedrina]ONH56706.1 acylneuraminate cytidylyltransferase [Pseudomonas cedrina subsp. cedrina]SDS15274.1 N-acylneuraminate cytidylyltransferase [Pseudomonas cedrina]